METRAALILTLEGGITWSETERFTPKEARYLIESISKQREEAQKRAEKSPGSAKGMTRIT